MSKNRSLLFLVFSLFFSIASLQARIVFTTIDTPGFYRLSDNLTNSVTITVSNVTFDLNGHTIAATNGIIINSGLDEICIQNGVIEADTDGIVAGSGCTNITLENMKVKEAIRGINFENVTGGLISNCEMTLNSTGLELDNSHKIVVKDCVASCNTHAGYCLLSSTTNTFENCKALSTGEGNIDIEDTSVFGFVSKDGYANIFERCIANATQALSTTDCNSLISGFALRGSESCTKIVDSEAANSTTSPSGVTVPYGILLEGTMDQLSSVTSAFRTGIAPTKAYWSSDGKYLAAQDFRFEISGSDHLGVFSFDRTVPRVELKTCQLSSADIVNWHPSDRYILYTSGTNLLLYEYDRTANTLTLKKTFDTGSTVLGNRGGWSPDGSRLAIRISASPTMLIYAFNQVAMEFTLLDTVTTAASSRINEIAWSHDGKLIAIGGNTGTDCLIELFAWDETIDEARSLDSFGRPEGFMGASVCASSMDWSYDDKYLAVNNMFQNNVSGDIDFLNIFEVQNETLNRVEVLNEYIQLAESIVWSPDGRFVVVSLHSTMGPGANEMRLYAFNRGVNQLSFINRYDPTFSVRYNLDWSPDGAYLAASNSFSNLDAFNIFRGLTFPEKNIVKNNMVYCNSGNECPGGVGIYGSSISNMITENTAYNNPENYTFVANVFNPLFGQAPSEIQNISLDGCDPVASPEDIALLIKQTLYKVCNPIPSQLDVIESKLDNPCAPTAITAAGTISSSGIYCLANEIAGAITIAASDVDLDLNNYKVVAGTPITVNGGLERVTIRNGVVESTSGLGITASAGTTNLTIKDVIVKNASAIGISLNSIDQGVISNCQIIENDEGMDLIGCSNIYVSDCVAIRNASHGYGLLGSSTCCFVNCKALNSGIDNTEIADNNVFGFVSQSGYGNVFERCIANATQALSTIDNSLVAGFALRGSEKCTKIIDSEAANTATSLNGFTIPYGIVLEASVANEITLTGLPLNPTETTTVDSVAWHPSGKYFAIAPSSSDSALIRVFAFDRITRVASQVATLNKAVMPSAEMISWHPSGNFLLMGGTTSGTSPAQVAKFDPERGTLSTFAAPDVLPTANVNGVGWSPDGKFAALGSNTSDTVHLRVYQFDPVAATLKLVATPDVDPSNVDPDSLQWFGQYITTKNSSSSTTIYFFDEGSQSLSLWATSNTTSGGGDGLSVSPDGRYVAVNSFGSPGIRVYEFDPDNKTLLQVASETTSAGAESIAWSSDGEYIAIGGASPDRNIVIYRFDRGTNTLYLEKTGESFGSGGVPDSMSWSPDGQFVLMGTTSSSSPVALYEVLTFPQKNVIHGNTVYCNSGSSPVRGIGISGSSTANMITGNTSYNNPMNDVTTTLPNTQNYAFVANVFNPLFGQVPSDIQNISLDGCDPVCTPEDVALLVKQTLFKVCNSIPSQLDVIEDKIDFLITGTGCQSFTLTQPTVITQSGNYCLANDISGQIQILSDDVTLDLNGRNIAGVTEGLVIGTPGGGDNDLHRITVRNGTVSGGSTGVGVLEGCTDIVLENIRAENASGQAIVAAGSTTAPIERIHIVNCQGIGSEQGLDLECAFDARITDCTFSNNLGRAGMRIENVTKATISGCDLTLNATGMELVRSSEITVDSCNAYSNFSVGFELDCTFTTCLRDCKAINTGENNNIEANNDVFGFLAFNGYGNIFERCIANATQALSTTGQDSLVAGFALRGSESCTKIIDSEAANGITSATGFTTPYGILIAGTLDVLQSVTAIDLEDGSSQGRSVDWSPDGKYLAVGLDPTSNTSNPLRVYAFDRINEVLTLIAGADFGIISLSRPTVQWSPDGNFLAVGISGINPSAQPLRIYQFNRTTRSLSQVASKAIGGPVYSVDWSFDGEYLAVGADSTVASELQIYRFDKVGFGLNQVATDSVTVTVNGVGWSPDGRFLAVGTDTGITNEFRVYKFQREVPLLTEVAGDESDTNRVNDVRWSPDGKFIGVAIGTNSGEVRVYEFTEDSSMLTLQTSDNQGVANAVDWSSDGKYLLAGFATNNQVVAYEFDKGPTYELDKIAMINFSVSDDCNGVSWAPDGKYIAYSVIAQESGTTDFIRVARAIKCPEKNIIKNNTVYCNSGNSCPWGIGISGSSIANMITGNTAYNNPQNYAYVANVFNQMFGSAPTDLQNVGLVGCEAICTPEDIPLLIKQVGAKLLVCAPSALSSSDVVSGEINITASGNYCLSEDITADINITSTCVSLDLNDRCLSGKISVSDSDTILIKNGFVNTPAPSAGDSDVTAINIASTVNRTKIINVEIKCEDTTDDGVEGRDGMRIFGNNTLVSGCIITAGAGADTSSGAAGSAGSGIVIGTDANKAVIESTFISTGIGGTSSSGSGGDGGAGISIEGEAQKSEISNCTILCTGDGGDGVGGGSTGGDGGTGITVASSALDNSIRNCTIRNTGSGGSGSTAGAGGKAIDDNVSTATALSMIYSNFAHNIANTLKFDLQASGVESGVLTPNPPTSTVVNPLANVYAS